MSTIDAPSNRNLAEINISISRIPLSDPRMADFMSRLDSVNALADGSPGFVWRLQTASGNATAVRAFGDPEILVNLSVWSSVEALEAFTYRSDHRHLLHRRHEWFEVNPVPSMCMWWLPSSDLPTVEDGEARLTHLRVHGPTSYSFSFGTTFLADGAAIVGMPNP